ncbi:MAG: hypothetical protein E7474_11545 [Ruminococcaceae bacterium]|nr:hypothetical protein [Oscillospiraceae bacterium]
MSEERLLQRLEDLNGRLAELRERLPQSCMDERYDRRFYARLTNEATDAVIPAHLFTVEDVLTAIKRAKERLDELRLERARAEERLAADAIPGQLVFAGFADEPLKLAS